jgi:hypothetical protein
LKQKFLKNFANIFIHKGAIFDNAIFVRKLFSGNFLESNEMKRNLKFDFISFHSNIHKKVFKSVPMKMTKKGEKMKKNKVKVIM